MKGFCRFFCFINLIFLIVLQINETTSNPILDYISTYITSDYCQKKLDFDVKTESYDYITDEIRYNLCKRQFPGYDSDGVISTVYKQCLGPKYTYQSFFNPCEVVCPFKPDSLLLSNYMEEEDEGTKCGAFMQTYRDTTRTFKITDTHQECGPNHFCNSNGCCVKRGQTSSTTTESPTTAKSETTSPLTSRPTLTTNETTETTTLSTTPITSTQTNSRTTTPLITSTISIPPPPHLSCNSVGLFKYPNDSTNRKYYKCVLKAELKVCPFGQIFDERLSHCVYIHETTATETSITTSSHTESTPTIDWHKYFNCTKEGFFRNPYDCSQFYRCYKNIGDNRHIMFSSFKCPLNQFFDQDIETCDIIEHYIEKHGECQTIPMPTLSSHF